MKLSTYLLCTASYLSFASAASIANLIDNLHLVEKHMAPAKTTLTKLLEQPAMATLLAHIANAKSALNATILEIISM